MSTSTANVSATEVVIDELSLTIILADGRTLTVPLSWFPRLMLATMAERTNFRLIGSGEGIHWPDLDEDISIQALILGKKSGESEASLHRWLQQRQLNTESSD
ncbi:MAG TPA: DUF2442 domain-containing protein [Pyrinomonadaceae bacterium]|nr:DUF2442 domain-containing protein [Pyrinomonadaceae bacterium]